MCGDAKNQILDDDSNHSNRGSWKCIRQTPPVITPAPSILATGSSGDSSGTRSKRSSSSSSSSPPKSVSIASEALVHLVESKNDMTDFQKSCVWWQRQDYEDFKDTVEALAMEQPSSSSSPRSPAAELVMNSNCLQQRSLTMNRPDYFNNCTTTSPTASPMTKHKLFHAHSGHSRRGLECSLSPLEGQQRYRCQRMSILAVLDEQRRQRVYRRTLGPEQLRTLSLSFTAWARELAFATAAADEQHVKVQFEEARQRPRESFLSGQYNNHAPEFMKPKKSCSSPTSSTASSKYRKTQTKPLLLQSASSASSAASSPKKSSSPRKQVILLESRKDGSLTHKATHTYPHQSSHRSKQQQQPNNNNNNRRILLPAIPQI